MEKPEDSLYSVMLIHDKRSLISIFASFYELSDKFESEFVDNLTRDHFGNIISLIYY